LPLSIILVVGARPNFVKVAPLLHALAELDDVRPSLLHTGQHYDWALSQAFIEQLGLPEPEDYLNVGSGSHAEQTAGVLVGVERVLDQRRPDALVVAGDVNSTMAAALAAAKTGTPVAHLESGLRSRDWTMPEEVNRAVTDRVSDLLLCPSQDAVDNLVAEGVAQDLIALVGNTMIDSLLRLLPAAGETGAVSRYGLERAGYALVTLHRPAVVDDPAQLTALLGVLRDLASKLPVVFPVHPRTRANIERGDPQSLSGITAIPPADYLEFIALEESARLVITDSGGVQEETSALGVACFTYRDSTERPITVELGTNHLIGVDAGALAEACSTELAGEAPKPAEIPLWDGEAGVRAALQVAELARTPPRSPARSVPPVPATRRP
jgi:UDP-N-acetylglucosamine 2-epimerase (non-hydrolysing)